MKKFFSFVTNTSLCMYVQNVNVNGCTFVGNFIQNKIWQKQMYDKGARLHLLVLELDEYKSFP